ncbi:hypothetical protein LguiA_014573 [Lonicera macranthoides]
MLLILSLYELILLFYLVDRGASLGKFGLKVETNMTKVEGRIIEWPSFKDGNQNIISADQNKTRKVRPKRVVQGMPVNKWALVTFKGGKTQIDRFGRSLKSHCNSLGMDLEQRFGTHEFDVTDLSDVSKVEDMLKKVVNETKLQIIICIMAKKHEGYRYIKWVSETKIGVITQCCLDDDANKGDHNFFLNLALKINAKCGGTNAELSDPLPGFNRDNSIMLIGADVSHPGASNSTSPSIAAVAASIDPAMACYAARVRPQDHREETIGQFGEMVKELFEAYKSRNNAKPEKIIIFRDGVSESQFNKVLHEELGNLERAIFDHTYKPTITLVVAMKRHRTRLFIDSDKKKHQGSENVPEGTVVDTVIVQPQGVQSNFYLCSHHGSIGTSRPTYYRVLDDKNNLTLEQMEKLVFHICCTCARCRNSVSLVPPVYYAHLAAFRGHAFRETLALEEQKDQSNYILERELRNTMFFV